MAYNARRAPNVSQYIANLNIPSAERDLKQNADPQELDSDLAMFTNTEFFDFDTLDLPDFSRQSGYNLAQEEGQQAAYNNPALNTGDFTVPDFTAYPNVAHDGTASGLPAVQPNPYQYQTVQSPVSGHHSLSGEKRKLDSLSSPASSVAMEEQSRMAAEEDKRRRNTAASARFRVKKKQREQALEKSAKDMTDKVSALEARVGQLEMENKWLKSLITEKNDGKADIADLYKKFTLEKETIDSRSTGQRTDGVGTKKVQEQKA